MPTLRYCCSWVSRNLSLLYSNEHLLPSPSPVSPSPRRETGASDIGWRHGHQIQSYRLFTGQEGRWGLKSSLTLLANLCPLAWPYPHRGRGAFSNLHIGAVWASSDPGWRAQRITSGAETKPILPLPPPTQSPGVPQVTRFTNKTVFLKGNRI